MYRIHERAFAAPDVRPRSHFLTVGLVSSRQNATSFESSWCNEPLKPSSVPLIISSHPCLYLQILGSQHDASLPEHSSYPLNSIQTHYASPLSLYLIANSIRTSTISSFCTSSPAQVTPELSLLRILPPELRPPSLHVSLVTSYLASN